MGRAVHRVAGLNTTMKTKDIYSEIQKDLKKTKKPVEVVRAPESQAQSDKSYNKRSDLGITDRG